MLLNQHFISAAVGCLQQDKQFSLSLFLVLGINGKKSVGPGKLEGWGGVLGKNLTQTYSICYSAGNKVDNIEQFTGYLSLNHSLVKSPKPTLN